MTARRALVYLPALLVLAILVPVIWPVPVHLGDWFQFWYAGHITAAGQNPLEIATWRDAVYGYPDVIDGAVANARREIATVPETPILYPVWVYPPWTAALFIPFGVLPLVTGVVLMHAVLLAIGIAVALWLTAKLALSAPARALALAMVFVYEPWVMATRTGHFSAVLLAGALVTLVALESGGTAALIAGGFLLSLKPHVAAGFGVLVLLSLVTRRDWRRIATAGAVLVLFAIVWYLRYPPPPITGAALLSRIDTDDVASTYALAELLVPGYGTVVGLLALAALGLASWWLARSATRDRPLTFVACALALSVAVSPYVHTYDHLLVAPAMLLPLAITADLRGPDRLAIGAATVTGALLVPWLAYFSDVHGRQAPSGIVPFVAIGLMVAATALARWRVNEVARRTAVAAVAS